MEMCFIIRNEGKRFHGGAIDRSIARPRIRFAGNLCRSRNGMSIGGLSAETGRTKSTVHRLLASMCARGYVQRDAETSVYRAGMRLCEMSSYIVDNLDIVERARASLERLEQCTDETVHLVMRDDKDIVYIHKSG